MKLKAVTPAEPITLLESALAEVQQNKRLVTYLQFTHLRTLISLNPLESALTQKVKNQGL